MGLSMAAYLFMCAVAQAQTSPPGKVYKHPLAGYTISVPKDTQLAEQGNRRDVVIRSRLGYDIKLQTGLSDPKKTIQSMVAKLESAYLDQTRGKARIGRGSSISGPPLSAAWRALDHRCVNGAWIDNRSPASDRHAPPSHQVPLTILLLSHL